MKVTCPVRDKGNSCAIARGRLLFRTHRILGDPWTSTKKTASRSLSARKKKEGRASTDSKFLAAPTRNRRQNQLEIETLNNLRFLYNVRFHHTLRSLSAQIQRNRLAARVDRVPNRTESKGLTGSAIVYFMALRLLFIEWANWVVKTPAR
jgi:hypothetical protein